MMYNVKRDCHCCADGARAGTRPGRPIPGKNFSARASNRPDSVSLSQAGQCPATGLTMEAGSSSGEAMKAAPRKGALWIVIAIVIAVAVTAAEMDLAVLPLVQPAPTGRGEGRTSW